MISKSVLSIICLAHILLAELSLCDKLRFVFGMFRHGARAPWKSLNENNIDIFGSKWEGESQLTDVGVRQHYLLGYKNKQKYFSQLNITDYNTNEFSIFSTETDRTVMSAYSELFGMFPPGSGPKLTEEQIPFAQPPMKTFNFSQKQEFLKDEVLQAAVALFPVHLFDKYASYFNLYDPKLCPRVKDYQDANKKSEKFLNYSNAIIKNYGDRIIKLINKTDINELKDYNSMYYVFDTFIANYFDGRNLDKLNETGINFEEFYNLTIDFLKWDQFYINYGDKDSIVARMSFSPVFRYLFDVIDARIGLDSSEGLISPDYYDSLNPKMFLYSGHDTSLAAMNVFLSYMFGEDRVKQYYTYFASSFYFELYKNETKSNSEMKHEYGEEYYLNILFNEKNIFGKSISYKEFKDQIKNKLMNAQDVHDFCSVKGAEVNNKLLLIILLPILISVCLVLGYLIYKRTSKTLEDNSEKQTNYSKV